MPMTTGKNQGALTITLLLAVMGILAYRVLHARTTIQHLNSELAQDQRSLAVAGLDHVGLVAAINGHGFTKPFLVGTSARTREAIRIENPADGIYCLMATTCPACATNLPVIRRLITANPSYITLVSVQDDQPTLAAYLARNQALGKSLAQATGSFVEQVPSYGVPVTLLVSRGRIAALHTGTIDASLAGSLLDSAQAHSAPN